MDEITKICQDHGAILIEDELFYDDWEKFVESMLYIKEVK